MSKTVSFKEQLALLKHATVLSGGIHEAQALQLRNYPTIIEGVKKAVTKIDTDSKVVHYTLTADTLEKTEKFETACKAIVKWVRAVIWDETQVVFYVNKEVWYDSRAE